MNKSLKFLSVAVLVIAILGAYLFPKVQAPVTEVGAQVQPGSVDSTQNGLTTYSYGLKFGVGTSTPCSIKSPNATTTLTFASLAITNASSTATTWTFAKATKINATTTKIVGYAQLASGAQATYFATATSTALTAPAADDTLVISPNTFLTWGVEGLTFTGLDATEMGGSCAFRLTGI